MPLIFKEGCLFLGEMVFRRSFLFTSSFLTAVLNAFSDFSSNYHQIICLQIETTGNNRYNKRKWSGKITTKVVERAVRSFSL